MTVSGEGAMLTAIMDALSLIQSQLGTIEVRLAALENAQAAAQQELASTRGALEVVARTAAYAHAAASGAPAPLPGDLLSDPLLARFRREMPAEWASQEPALRRWRDVVVKAETAELTAALIRQYQRSPTETSDDLALRHRMAALSREELNRRGVVPPEHPNAESVLDTSSETRRQRAGELARIWADGSALALYGEAELASAIDALVQSDDLAVTDPVTYQGLRREMAVYIAAGHRLIPRRRTAKEAAERGIERG